MIFKNQKHFDEWMKKHSKVENGRIIFYGEMFLSQNENIVIPDNLTVLGNLNLRYSKGIKIPKKLIIKNVENNLAELGLTGSDIYYIPSCCQAEEIWNDRLYTIDEYNEEFNSLIPKRRFYFLREKIIILQNLLEIPEMWDEVYYSQKNDFMKLLKKV